MRLAFLLSSLLGFAAALELSRPDEHKRDAEAGEPTEVIDGSASSGPTVPEGAPEGFHVGIVHLDGARRRRQEGPHSRRHVSPRDFFECGISTPAPNAADCQTIVQQVQSTHQNSVIQANSCFTYVLGTCQGFFCSLCSTLATNTDYIGGQLEGARQLCVANGNAGALVGESPPQWDAGFVHVGSPLPSYDVC